MYDSRAGLRGVCAFTYRTLLVLVGQELIAALGSAAKWSSTDLRYALCALRSAFCVLRSAFCVLRSAFCVLRLVI